MVGVAGSAFLILPSKPTWWSQSRSREQGVLASLKRFPGAPICLERTDRKRALTDSVPGRVIIPRDERARDRERGAQLRLTQR